MDFLDLCGEWEMKPVEVFDGKYDGAGWVSTTVPGHWQLQGDFEYYGGKMVYRKKFSCPQRREGKRYFIRFDGIFYWSIINLNGARIGENEGYFFPREYEVTDVIEDSNELVVEIDCPYEKTKNRKRMITGVFSHWDCLDPASNPGGIWLPVRIVETGDVRIEDPMAHASYFTDANLRAEIRFTADSTRKTRINAKVVLTPDNFEGKTHVFEESFLKTVGKNNYQMLVDLDEYSLWWTHDHGHPNLYRVKIEVTEEGADGPSDVTEFRTGLRTFELRKYIAYLNGRRIFIRGNNYPPADTRIATVTPDTYERDFKLMTDAHINLIRVHAHVDHPLFYEKADEAGIIVWQDFPLQWYYLKETESSALYQVERMVKTLYNHPSIGVWCCHNEPFQIVDPSDINVMDLLKCVWSLLGYNWNREVLDEKLKERVLSVDTTRFVQKCSGFMGLGKEPGDDHFYFGWYPPFGKTRNFDFYVKFMAKSIRFPTEFGAQSLPNYENSIRFMDTDIRKVDWKHLEERHHFQPGMMKRFVRHEDYETLEDYINATQAHQSYVNKFIIDRLRLRKYDPTGGVTAFLLLDSNPAIQWSLIDYWRTPKKSYESFCTNMNPQYVFAIVDKDEYRIGEAVELPVYVVNDEYIEWRDASVTAIVTDPDGNEISRMDTATPLETDMRPAQAMAVSFRPEKAGGYKLNLHLDYGLLGGLHNSYDVNVKL